MYGMSWDELLTPSVRSGKRAGQSLPPMTPEEEQTLLGSLLQKTQGALETVGNTLDLPGSMVRDLLSGQNPLDQLLTPFSSENRTMGTDLLNNLGLLPENDPTAWEVNDVLGGIAGLGTEIALDPLTYLTFGGSAAKTIAGKAASKVGLLDDVVKVGTAKAGRALGKREAMMMTSVNDLLSSLPEAERSLKQTAMANAGYDAATMGDQALGSPLGWQIPWTDIGGAFGAGAKAGEGAAGIQKYARGLDAAGEYLSKTAPVRAVRMLFDPPAGDQLYGPGQKVGGEIAKTRKTAEFTTKSDMWDSLAAIPAEDADKFDSMAYFLDHPSKFADDPAAAFASVGLPPLSDETMGLLGSRIKSPQAEIHQRMADLGHTPGDMKSDFGVEHNFRQMTEAIHPDEAEAAASRWKQTKLNTSSHNARDSALDVPGGTVAVNRMVKDPSLVGKAVEGGAVLTDDAERRNRVLDHFLDWMPEKRDEYLAQGKTLDEAKDAFRAEVSDAAKLREQIGKENAQVKRRAKYEAEPDTKSIVGSEAHQRGLDPVATRMVLEDTLDREAAEFDTAFNEWDGFFRSEFPRKGNSTMRFWKAVHASEDAAVMQRKFPGFDALAQRAQAVNLPGVHGDVNPADSFFQALKENGSPTNFTGMNKPPGKIHTDKTWIEKRLNDPYILGQIADNTGLPPTLKELPPEAEDLVKFYDRAGDTADKLKRYDPRRQTEGVGLFGNHPLQDNAQYIKEGKVSIANLEGIHKVFADEAVSTPGPTDFPIEEAFTRAGFSEPKRAANTLRKTLREMGKNADYIPQDAILWANKTIERATSPESVTWLSKMIDKLTNVWKLGSTAAPAFHVRNYAGGIVQNLLEGFYSPVEANRILRDARKAMAGETISGLAERVPMFKGMSDEDATKKFLQMAESLGMFQSQLDETGAQSVANAIKPGEFKVGVKVKAIDGRRRGGNFGTIQAIGPNPDEYIVQFKPSRGEVVEVPLHRRDLVWQSSGQGHLGFGGSDPLERLTNRLPGKTNPITLKGGLQKAMADVSEGFSALKQGEFSDKLNPLAVPEPGGRKTSEFALAALQQNIGNFVEGQNRLSALQGLLEKGYDPLEAKKLVDAAHVDYGNLTSFEKQYMRRAMPFYSFTRRMTEHVVNRLLERPGGPYGMAIRAANAPRQNDVYVPDYISEGTAIPLGPGRFVTGLGLMHEAPFNLAATGPTAMKTIQRTGQKLAAMLNPMAKLPIELTTGTSLYTGRPLRDLYQYPFEGGGDAVLANLTLSSSPLGRTLASARKLTDTRKDPLTKGLNLLTGVQIADQSGGPERAKEFAARKVTDDYLRDNPKFGVFERIYPKKGMLETLTPTEMDLWRFKMMQEKKARAAAKERAAQAT